MGFELNMPYYLHRSLFKMAKRYKYSQADTSLFHIGLIKMVLVYELGLRKDSWHEFLSRNGFGESNPPQVDKPVVAESKSIPVPYDVLLPRPKLESPTSLPKSMPKQTEVVKTTTQKIRAKTGVDTRGK
jgi:hypothetical protein